MLSLIEQLCAVVPVVSVGLYAGTLMCISFLMYPAMMSLDTDNAVRFFAKFYPPAAIQQPGTLITGLAASIARLALTHPPPLTSYAHLLNIAHSLCVPMYTLTYMVAENNALVAAGSKKQEDQRGDLRGMLERWGPRNDVRTYAGVLMFAALVLAEANAQ